MANRIWRPHTQNFEILILDSQKTSFKSTICRDYARTAEESARNKYPQCKANPGTLTYGKMEQHREGLYDG